MQKYCRNLVIKIALGLNINPDLQIRLRCKQLHPGKILGLDLSGHLGFSEE